MNGARNEPNFDILTEHIDSHSKELAGLCSRFFDGMPKITDEETEKNVTVFRQYLHDFSFFDDVFYQFIVNCCLFSSGYPKDGFISFRDALPEINLDSEKRPKCEDPGRVFFTDHVDNINYKSSHMRAALKFFICRCTSFFMKELLLRSSVEQVSKNGIIEIVRSITEHIFSHSYNQFGVAYMTEALTAWADSFKLISRVVPGEVIQEAIGALKRPGITATQKMLALLLFKRIVIPDVETAMPLMDVVTGIYQTAPLAVVHNLSGEFLLNLVGQILQKNRNARVGVVHELAKKYVGPNARYPESAFEIIAMISNFQESVGVDEYLRMAEPGCKGACLSAVAGVAIKVKRSEFNAVTLVEWLNRNVSETNAMSDEVGHLFVAIWKNNPEKLLDMIPKLKADFTVGILKAGRKILQRTGSESGHYQRLMEWMYQNVARMSEKHANDGMTTEVFFDTISFTLGLRIAVEEREKTLKCLVKNLPRSSMAFYRPVLSDPTPVNDVTDAWLGFADVSFKDIFRLHRKDILPNQVLSDVEQFACLCCIPYLEPNESVIEFVIRSLFSKDTKCGALAIRTIQTVIHMHPEVTVTILERLQYCVEHGKLNGSAVAVAANAITFAVESAQYQRIEISQQLVLALKCATVLGFCTGYPSVRKRLHECLRFRTDFVDREEAKRKAVLAVTHMPPEEVKMLPNVTFDHLILSDMPFLFLFFISSANTQTLVPKLVSLSFRLIVQFLSNNRESKEFTIIGNSLALALSLEPSSLAPGDLDAKSMSVLTEATKRTAQYCGSNQFGEFGDVFLCGMVSGLAEIHQPFILPIFASDNEIHQRVLCYCLKESINQHKLHPLGRDGKLKPFIGEILSSTVDFCFETKLVNSVFNGASLSPALLSYSNLHLLLDDFAIVLKFIFNEIYAFWKDPNAFLVTQTYVSPQTQYPFSDEKWFVLLANLSFYGDCSFTVSVINALASWLCLFEIPDRYFTAFIPLMMDISELVPEITYPVFGRYTEHLVRYFLNERRFHVFKGIVAQLSCQSIKCCELLPDSATLQENPTLRVLYRYCGSLVVLGLYHAMSKFCDHRKIAMEFLNSLVVLVMLMRNEKQSAIVFFNHISMIQQKMKSYTFFIHTTIGELNRMLSKIFGFCSEQVLGEIIHILKSISEHKRPIRSSTSAFQSKQYTSVSAEILRPKMAGSSFPTATSTFDIGSILSPRMQLRVTKRKSHVQFDKVDKIGSFITDWLKPFTYDLRIKGISARCEPQFRQFCLYSFINAVLCLSSHVGLSEPFAAVLDIVNESSKELMMVCLVDLQRANPELNEAAQRSMVYIYHSTPDTFTKFVDQFLRVSCWWFNEVQLIKSDADMKSVLESDTNASERQGEEDMYSETSVFNSTIPFIFSVFLLLLRDRSDSLSDIHGHIVTFCYLFINTQLHEIVDQMLCHFTKAKEPELFPRGQSFPSLAAAEQEERWKIAEILPFLSMTDDQNKYLLEWGLCCGDINVAKRALNIYHRMGCTLPSSAVETTLRSIQLVSSALFQRIDPSNFDRANQPWFLKAVSDDATRPTLKTYVQYLAAGSLVLLDYVKSSSDYDMRIYKFAVSFLRASSSEYSELFTVALTIINEYANHCTIDFNELIPLLFGLQIDSVDALRLVFRVIYTLDKSMKYDLTKTADIIFMIALIPYVWSTDRSLLYQRFPKEQVESPDFLGSFMKSVLPYLSEESMGLILTFFSHAVRFGDAVQRMAVYLETQAIIAHMQSPGQECSLLLYHLITDRENEASVTPMFQVAISRKIKVLVPAQVNSTKTLTFPEITCIDINPSAWKQEADDVFASFATFPLLYLTDVALEQSPLLTDVKRAAESMKIVPFTKWTEDLFQAQLQNSAEIDTNNDRMDIEIHPETPVEQALSIVLGPRAHEAPQDLPTTPNPQIEESPPWNPFLMSNEEVVHLGAPILATVDLDLTSLL